MGRVFWISSRVRSNSLVNVKVLAPGCFCSARITAGLPCAEPSPRLIAGPMRTSAKWLTKTPKVLILNEPTRGMDVGAKREVLDLIRSLKEQGVAIILMSTEPETVMAESDRILVMSKGKITAEFVDERVTKDRLLAHA